MVQNGGRPPSLLRKRFPRSIPRRCRRSCLAVLLTFVLGILKEIADYILPNHSADMKDIFCDIVGIGAGTILVGLQIWLAAIFV